ncbi:hypothetical protein DL240_16105 [Lujinxingia litoralis]|uniref:Mechanosensitive ion channel MscS porin domain-containing protein n=1 Tax=Lujinxingia litoralis TaxID=2211119 RepID=A0A328C1R1_9DELT|nr:hypothetical protein DL240_16105 [Lujinxingia litoralis]
MLGLIIALLLWCGAAYAQSPGPPRQLWEQRQEELVEAEARLEAALSEYQKSVERVEKLKRDEASGQASRRELEAALRASHGLLEGVQDLQIAVLTGQEALEQARQALVDELARRQRSLEGELARARGPEQTRLIAELNRLSQERTRLDAVPHQVDPERVSRIIAQARQVEGGHPRDLLAVADELEDTEAQLRQRLGAVDARLQELERSRQLMRRARDFSERERFFEENNRARQIVRQGGDSRPTDATDDGSNSDQPAPGDMESGADPEVGAPSEGGSAPDWDGADETPEPDFEGSDETLVIESLVDPEQMSEPASSLSPGATERSLRTLRRERRALQAQVEELRERARELREQAEEAWR